MSNSTPDTFRFLALQGERLQEIWAKMFLTEQKKREKSLARKHNCLHLCGKSHFFQQSAESARNMEKSQKNNGNFNIGHMKNSRREGWQSLPVLHFGCKFLNRVD